MFGSGRAQSILLFMRQLFTAMKFSRRTSRRLKKLSSEDVDYGVQNDDRYKIPAAVYCLLYFDSQQLRGYPAQSFSVAYPIKSLSVRLG
jgi:hypothetical protein